MNEEVERWGEKNDGNGISNEERGGQRWYMAMAMATVD
ncbi:uncharacterized protein G2W53_034871 [Senna tora]|uniref:Uncharacterized protein n=1 Tax=Senna tora TaxID=362788 RepID=A0A834T1J0_9FABA|nr:uncharacterized protein G2W53_034871 [Senna tora]